MILIKIQYLSNGLEHKLQLLMLLLDAKSNINYDMPETDTMFDLMGMRYKNTHLIMVQNYSLNLFLCPEIRIQYINLRWEIPLNAGKLFTSWII